MALDILFCKDLVVNVENSLVRTFTLFPKRVTFTPWYGLMVLGNTLKSCMDPEKGEVKIKMIELLSLTEYPLDH